MNKKFIRYQAFAILIGVIISIGISLLLTQKKFTTKVFIEDKSSMLFTSTRKYGSYTRTIYRVFLYQDSLNKHFDCTVSYDTYCKAIVGDTITVLFAGGEPFFN